jgi:hypothetical protein
MIDQGLKKEGNQAVSRNGNRWQLTMNLMDTLFKQGSSSEKQDSFEEFEATELYCPNCKRAVPVRRRLLLVLPEGDKYEYLCAFCLTAVGTKIARSNKPFQLIMG